MMTRRAPHAVRVHERSYTCDRFSAPSRTSLISAPRRHHPGGRRRSVFGIWITGCAFWDRRAPSCPRELNPTAVTPGAQCAGTSKASAWHDALVDRASVHLRPFEEHDLVLCDRAATDSEFGGPFEWGGFGSSGEYRRRWHEDGLLGKSPFNLVVASDDDDSAVGWVDWRDTERAGPGVYEIGALVVPELRGRGLGTSAQSQLVDYLFATTSAHRIWAGTDVDNTAEQRALERCGFVQEGRLRGHHWRDGARRDTYIYGLIRDDNEARPGRSAPVRRPP